MFSLDKFYNILHNQLISKFQNGRSAYFQPFGTYENRRVLSNHFELHNVNDSRSDEFKNEAFNQYENFFHCYFFDQEPFYQFTVDVLTKTPLIAQPSTLTITTGPNHIKILANSEKSQLLSDTAKENDFYNWYYFFHGFAALDWYRNFQYVDMSSFNRFDKVFICYNNLISNLRSYRLHLVSNFINQDLLNHGLVSLQLKDTSGTWQETVEDIHNPLDPRARAKITRALSQCSSPMIIDTDTPNGSLSAGLNLDITTKALFHVVTETVYFDTKLHLTEKVFKPIVSQRPFFLVAAPGNLNYLKSYGFKTFDHWIDESYDLEEDHYIRIEKITEEIARLCAMEPMDLIMMHKEMEEVLEYNFNHFYTTFKNTIVDELVDNFDGVLRQINHGRLPNNHSKYHHRWEIAPDYLENVKKLLKQ